MNTASNSNNFCTPTEGKQTYCDHFMTYLISNHYVVRLKLVKVNYISLVFFFERMRDRESY